MEQRQEFDTAEMLAEAEKRIRQGLDFVSREQPLLLVAGVAVLGFAAGMLARRLVMGGEE